LALLHEVSTGNGGIVGRVLGVPVQLRQIAEVDGQGAGHAEHDQRRGHENGDGAALVSGRPPAHVQFIPGTALPL
jgi:hypothetical protein